MDSFAIIDQLEQHQLLPRMAAALVRVADEVVATHRKGSVTITLSVEQFQNEPIVLVKALVKERIPESAPLGAMFYAVGDGDLSKSDPRQTEMEFRVVPERPSDVRRVAEQMEEAE